MPTKLVLIACSALLLLSAPIAAHAAAGAAPRAGSDSSTPSEPAKGEPPPAGTEGGSKPAEGTAKPEPPVSPPPAAEETPGGAVEAEEEALSMEAEARLAAEEASALQRIERETGTEEQIGQPGGSAAMATCLVPSLRGDALRTARRALSKAHCKLGRVFGPRRHRARLVVTRQGERAGALLFNETPVAVRLGKPRSKRA